MPLLFDNPQTVAIQAAKVQAIMIRLDGELVVSCNYVEGPEAADGSIEPIRLGTHSFSEAEYASVDPDGSTYDAVKDAAYKLLALRLGPGQIT